MDMIESIAIDFQPACNSLEAASKLGAAFRAGYL